MTNSRGASPAGSLVRSILIVLLIALMFVLAVTLWGRFWFPSSTEDSEAPETAAPEAETPETAAPEAGAPRTEAPGTEGATVSEGESTPAGPAVVVPLGGDDTAQGGVACGRPVGSAPGDPFRIQIEDRSGSSEDVIVGVSLLNADGGRSARQVVLPGATSEGVRQVSVPDSGDGSFTSCVITAIQRGDRVILTGE